MGMTSLMTSKALTSAGRPWRSLVAATRRATGTTSPTGLRSCETFKAAGAKMVGYVDAGSYNHAASKSVRDGKFLGCPFDEDNQSDLSEDRAKEWVAQLKSEGMPL